MIKTIFCFILCVFGYAQIEAQSPVVDSLRTLVQKINNISEDDMYYCEDVDIYRNNISKIDPTTFGNALTQFLAADSQFIRANNFECPASKIISNLNIKLKGIKSTDKDSIQILKAIMYVKVRIKASEFAGLKLVVLTDKNEKIRNPIIALNSFEPAIVPPGNASDSVAGEIYIRKGIKYGLTVTNSGYSSYHGTLSIQKDTVLTLILSAVSAGSGSAVTPCPPVSTAPCPEEHSYWWIPAVLLGLVLVALVWKNLSGRKKQELSYEPQPVKMPANGNTGNNDNSRKLKESISQLQDEIKEKDNLINKYAGEIAVLHAVPKLKGESSKYFFTEMMMTAGPRKKHNEDKDLGEDVCGFIMVGDDVLVWLLDGSSDFYCLRHPETQREYFSSRLLAQCIARELKSHFGEGQMESFDKTMVTILGDVKSDWLEAIRSLPESEKEVLKSNIKDGNIPECAATVLIGRLSLNGELIVYRSGDSKMLVYETSGGQKVFLNTTLSSKNPSSNDRVFFRMMLTEGELDIHIYTKLFEIVKLENIQTIIGMSDGIGNVTVDDLKKEYPANSDAMRSEIIYQLQGTQDDKSIYFIEIKE